MFSKCQLSPSRFERMLINEFEYWTFYLMFFNIRSDLGFSSLSNGNALCRALVLIGERKSDMMS